MRKTLCFEYGVFKRLLKDCRLNREVSPTIRAKMGDNLPTVMCLNPHDPQMMRIFSQEGAFHTVAANSGGGQARDGVFVRCFQQNNRITSTNNKGLK